MTWRQQRVVVVGGGLAGLRLAQRLGSAPTTVTVSVFGEEPHVPYNRVLLAEILAGRYAAEVAALPSAGPGLRRGVRAVLIDRHARLVHGDDGSVEPYDVLVLATGSNPVLPPLRGLFEPGDGELPDGVHPFRTMDDCTALSDAVGPGVRTVVIGGGLLGVSAARALAARGAQVVLAQQGERLMERQLDAPASALLRSHLTELGVEVHTECRVRAVLTDPPGSGPGRRDARPAPAGPRRVTGVELADGYRLDADLVVLACGVRPRVGLARAAGLDVRQGVLVDDELRTSDPRIHAIGDCAEHGGRVYGLAGPALEQADVLASILLSGPAAAGHPEARSASPAHAAPHAHAASPAHAAPEANEAPVPGPGQGAGAGHGRTAGAPGTPGPDTAEAVHGAGAPVGAPGPDPGPDTGPATPAGAPLRYTGTRALTRLTLAHGPAGPAPLDLAAFGETTPLPGDDVVRLTDATRRTYRQVVVRGDRLVGGVLLGELSAVGTLARAWEGDEPLSATDRLIHLLTDDGGPTR
ncbi:FAD-dependent oxidoreductase [Streptomyces sp. NPDC089799]|uniref:NAD(P)/FAD-dependent oxidoreductase n=1 Tax=Streptomyces sp. NPDC089799 TaxID=3155066 RepID=UPI00343BE041